VTPIENQPAATSADVTAYRGGQPRRVRDRLAEETPVALVFNGISFAVMLATPADLEDFALGFALTEGLLERPGELYGVEVETTPEGIAVQLQVASACEFRLKERRRNLAGRTGCGLCGAESLEQVQRTLPTPVCSALHLQPDAVRQALAAIGEFQQLQQATGAVHAAAWCSAAGDVQRVREDIGRHNALDKLVGALVRAKADMSQGFFCITSRASFEMVQKATMAGASMLVAVSAPTALAVRTARTAGLALAGFARGQDFVAYTFPERFGLPSA
jgi:FdhD protein